MRLLLNSKVLEESKVLHGFLTAGKGAVLSPLCCRRVNCIAFPRSSRIATSFINMYICVQSRLKHNSEELYGKEEVLVNEKDI